MRIALQCDNIHQGQPDCPWMDKLLPYRADEGIHRKVQAVAKTRRRLYKQSNGDVVNYLLSPEILAIRKGDRPVLVNPLEYYLR